MNSGLFCLDKNCHGAALNCDCYRRPPELELECMELKGVEIEYKMALPRL